MSGMLMIASCICGAYTVFADQVLATYLDHSSLPIQSPAVFLGIALHARDIILVFSIIGKYSV